MNSTVMRILQKTTVLTTIMNCSSLLLFSGMVVIASAQAFIHPGLGLNQAELDIIKSEVNAGVQPRKSGWDKMLSDGKSKLSYNPNPKSHVGADGGTSDGLADDILAAFSHALQWYVTGNQAHADKAIQIMNGWAKTLKSIDNKSNEYHRQEILVAGWSAQPFCEAAEIIRHTNAGWSSSDIAQFEKMLKDIFYPLVKDKAGENGNWEASCINSMIAIGVFCNDRAIFNRGIDFFKGSGKGAVGKYIYESGECQEVCRDMGHTQMGIGELVDAAEIAWKQGVDLYSELPDPKTGLPRLAEGLEFSAKILVGGGMQTTCGFKSGGGLDPMWEKAWNHYGNRMGLSLPNVKKCVERTRPEGYSWKAMYSWGTLTHANLATGEIVDPPPPPPPPTLKVDSLVLIDADTDTEIIKITDNMIVDISTHGTANLSIRADVDGSIGSLVWGLDENLSYRTENNPPYTLTDEISGDYAPWNLTAGDHVITATAFEFSDGAGRSGDTLEISFTLKSETDITVLQLFPAKKANTVNKTSFAIYGLDGKKYDSFQGFLPKGLHIIKMSNTDGSTSYVKSSNAEVLRYKLFE